VAKKEPIGELLGAIQDLLIVQLALAGADNHSIRRIAGVQMDRVTRISKELKKLKRRVVATV